MLLYNAKKYISIFYIVKNGRPRKYKTYVLYFLALHKIINNFLGSQQKKRCMKKKEKI